MNKEECGFLKTAENPRLEWLPGTLAGGGWQVGDVSLTEPLGNLATSRSM